MTWRVSVYVYITYIYLYIEQESFKNIPEWINYINKIHIENAVLVLVGNKSDLRRSISKEEGIAYAKENNLLYFEVSALKNDNINHMILSSIAELSSFSDEADKNKVISELEEGNHAKVNISVLSGVNIDKEEEEGKEGNVKKLSKTEKEKVNLKKDKKKKGKCC